VGCAVVGCAGGEDFAIGLKNEAVIAVVAVDAAAGDDYAIIGGDDSAGAEARIEGAGGVDTCQAEVVAFGGGEGEPAQHDFVVRLNDHALDGGAAVAGNRNRQLPI